VASIQTTIKSKNEVLFLGKANFGEWVKEYGILGVPLGLAIILIVAIACFSRSNKKR